jgi:hypothetical protein
LPSLTLIMLLVDDILFSITKDHDIERFINAFKTWNANDSKDVSLVFPRDILDFVGLFIDKLYLYVKQRNNPASPTVADSEEKVCTKSSSFWCQAHVNLRIMPLRAFPKYHTAT